MRSRIIVSTVLLLMILQMVCPCAASGDTDVISVGKSYSVSYVTPIDNAYPGQAYTPEKKLTDGRIASDKHDDANWLTLYRGTAVRVDIDLGSVMAVGGVKIGELQHKAYGIYCSRYLNVWLSDDGETYHKAGSVEDGKKITSDDVQRVEFDCRLDRSYAARYVRAEFSSDVFTYVDEVSVYGSENPASASPVPSGALEPADKGIASPVDGLRAICLMYISGEYTAEKLKPYVAYIGENGEVKDRMFDSLVFLGNAPKMTGEKYHNKADMELVVESILGTGTGLQLTALNEVIGELKGSLFEEDYKYPVFVTVPFPEVDTDGFGEIDGERITVSTLDNRKKIVDWYIAYLTNRFAECGFENLELKGLYWFNEIIQYQHSEDEEAIVAYFNEKAHGYGYKTLWIPYYSACGIDRLDVLGFDAACMQSGVAFDGNGETGTAKYEACLDCAEIAKKFGMGVEFEADMNKSNFFKRFEQYVHAAYKYGVMDGGVMMMYQVGKHLYNSAVGTDSKRELYDLTYQYCSKTYIEYPPVIGESEITVTVKAGGFAKGRVTVSSEGSDLNALKIAGITKPEGVFFSAFGNGYYEVDAYSALPGTYHAAFSVTDGYNDSNTVSFTIIVEPEEEGSSEGPSGSSGEISGKPENGGNGGKIWLFAAIGAAAAALGGIAFLIIKRSKRNKSN